MLHSVKYMYNLVSFLGQVIDSIFNIQFWNWNWLWKEIFFGCKLCCFGIILVPPAGCKNKGKRYRNWSQHSRLTKHVQIFKIILICIATFVYRNARNLSKEVITRGLMNFCLKAQKSIYHDGNWVAFVVGHS